MEADEDAKIKMFALCHTSFLIKLSTINSHYTVRYYHIVYYRRSFNVLPQVLSTFFFLVFLILDFFLTIIFPSYIHLNYTIKLKAKRIKEIIINEPMKNRLFITIGFLILIIMFFPFLDYSKINNIGFINVELIKQGKITEKLKKTRILAGI